MTTDSAVLPVADIRALRLTCRACGAPSVIPLSAHRAPVQCFNCASPIPGLELAKVVADLRWLQGVVTEKGGGLEAAFDAALEYVGAP